MAPCPSQRGAASLVVVSVLLFIMLLVAAYANRSLISELKTSANQYRAIQTGEAAEAAAEWALAQLNTGRVTDACKPSSDPADATYRQRTLSIDALGPRTFKTTSAVQSACIYGGSEWACTCANAGVLPALNAPKISATAPAFSITYSPSMAKNASRQSIQISASACSAADENTRLCNGASNGEAVSTVVVDAALVPALAAPPTAAITSTGTVYLDGGRIGVRNTDQVAGGVTVNATQVVPGSPDRLSTIPGSPNSVVEDPSLSTSQRHDLLFQATFGMPPSAYKVLPTVVRVSCVNDCSADLLAAYAKGTNMIWVEGDMPIVSDVSIGSATAPVALVVNGNIRITGAAKIQGVVWAKSLQWDGMSAGYLRGALVTQGDVSGTGTAEFIYDGNLLSMLNQQTGTFVRVPGSWRDF
jgi:hypothetical protein